MRKEKESSDTILEVILDDGDEFIECIESAFIQNDIQKAKLVSARGKLKNIRMAVTRAGSLRRVEYEGPYAIKNVSGNFSRMKDGEYMGDAHISLERDQIRTMNGVLLKGTACGEVNIRFRVITEISVGIIQGRRNITMVKEKMLKDVKPKEKKPIIVA